MPKPEVAPNSALESARVLMQIANLRGTIARQEFENLEMDERKKQNVKNVAASHEAIADLELKLTELS